MQSESHPEIAALTAVSARLGRNPLLVQAASGNTSIKLDGVLWIKASGKWLARAGQEEMFVPLDLDETKAGVERGLDLARVPAPAADDLRPSIETAMHAVIPHCATIHVHSVNVIAWAVRKDGRARCAERLAGLEWQWIPYVSSGLPLAREVRKRLALAPRTKVFVLANHGLVVCGDDILEAEALLLEVEQRLAIRPRQAPQPSAEVLEQVIAGSSWSLPDREVVHALGTDAISRAILQAGTLYPCQAIFLGPRVAVWPVPMPPAREARGRLRQAAPQFILVEDRGVIVSKAMNGAGREMLSGLAEVVQRLDSQAHLRYLTGPELDLVLSEDAHHYRGLVEQGGSCARRASA